MKNPFAFQRALITGASSGLGKVLAIRLAEKKIPLMLHGRNQKELDALTAQLQSKIDVASLVGDLCFEQDREKLSSWIEKNSPDLVINNAGAGLYGPALEHLIEEQMHLATVNALAPLHLCLQAAKTLQEQGKKGVILNVSSVSSFYTLPSMSVYAASKAFLTHFSQSFDLEMQPHGIRILVACPGPIHTNFAARAAKNPAVHRSSWQMSKNLSH